MSFSIYEIPKPASEEDVSKYTEIRLSTLSTNPEAFGSTYARESAFTPDQWVARVNTSGRKIFIAIDKDKWIGTLNVLYPEMLLGGPKSTPYPPEISATEEKGDLDVLMIVDHFHCVPSARSLEFSRLVSPQVLFLHRVG